MLNHFKKCTPSSRRSHAVCGTDNESNSSSSISSTSTAVRRVSGMNTLDNIVKWSGKKVGEDLWKNGRWCCCLSHHFVKIESLDNFALAPVLGTTYGCVSASNFIVGHLHVTVRMDIAKSLHVTSEHKF